MRTLLTFPGANGDTFLQWSAARTFIHYHPGEYTVGLGSLVTRHGGSMERLLPLFRKYSAVPVGAEMFPGVQVWQNGGQPWDFGMHELPKGFDRVLHCGYRDHPLLPVAVETGRALEMTSEQIDTIPHFPSFVVPDVERVPRRLVFHSSILGQTGEVAPAWRFLDVLLGRHQLGSHFDILAVGWGEELERYQKLGLRTEKADWCRTAELLAGADAALCGGSAVAALAGCLHVPCVRVGNQYESETYFGFRPFSNYAPGQLNVVTAHYRAEDLGFDFLQCSRRKP